jgi:ribosomal protein S18 acetylase RimI-like enzyme
LTEKSYIIREVTDDSDFMAVLPLLRDLMSDADRDSISPEQACAYWRQSHQCGVTTYIADKDGEAIAVFCLTVNYNPTCEPYYRFNNFVVKEDKRSMGYGTSIMRDAERIVSEQGGTCIILEVLDSRERAGNLYRNHFDYQYLCPRLIKDLKSAKN